MYNKELDRLRKTKEYIEGEEYKAILEDERIMFNDKYSILVGILPSILNYEDEFLIEYLTKIVKEIIIKTSDFKNKDFVDLLKDILNNPNNYDVLIMIDTIDKATALLLEEKSFQNIIRLLKNHKDIFLKEKVTEMLNEYIEKINEKKEVLMDIENILKDYNIENNSISNYQLDGQYELIWIEECLRKDNFKHYNEVLKFLKTNGDEIDKLEVIDFANSEKFNSTSELINIIKFIETSSTNKEYAKFGYQYVLHNDDWTYDELKDWIIEEKIEEQKVIIMPEKLKKLEEYLEKNNFPIKIKEVLNDERLIENNNYLILLDILPYLEKDEKDAFLKDFLNQTKEIIIKTSSFRNKDLIDLIKEILSSKYLTNIFMPKKDYVKNEMLEILYLTPSDLLKEENFIEIIKMLKEHKNEKLKANLYNFLKKNNKKLDERKNVLKDIINILNNYNIENDFLSETPNYAGPELLWIEKYLDNKNLKKYNEVLEFLKTIENNDIKSKLVELASNKKINIRIDLMKILNFFEQNAKDIKQIEIAQEYMIKNVWNYKNLLEILTADSRELSESKGNCLIRKI